MLTGVISINLLEIYIKEGDDPNHHFTSKCVISDEERSLRIKISTVEYMIQCLLLSIPI